MENEITDLQQRLDFSKYEQQEDVWCRSWGFNKLLLATGLLFYFSPRQLVRMSVHVCVCIVMRLKLQPSLWLTVLS